VRPTGQWAGANTGPEPRSLISHNTHPLNRLGAFFDFARPARELVALQIHDVSPRRPGPFVALNRAALVESLLEAELFGIEERTATGVRGRKGKVEYADGGTLFLDEVGDLSASAQAKLLRALQDLSVERVGGQGVRRIDTRVVAATNKRLASLVEAGVVSCRPLFPVPIRAP
jgi:DNA-binding NtrC family response regulator